MPSLTTYILSTVSQFAKRAMKAGVGVSGGIIGIGDGQAKQRSQSKLNRWISIILIVLNITAFIVALVALACGIYSYTFEWGTISDTYFSKFSLGLILWGFSVLISLGLSFYGMYR